MAKGGAGPLNCPETTGADHSGDADRQGATHYVVRATTASDIDAMVELHLRCFRPKDHLATLMGRRFIREVYRWFVTSPRGISVGGFLGGELVAFATVCNGPYHRLMFTENKLGALWALLTRPWLFLHPQMWKRLVGLLSGPDEVERILAGEKGAAHCGLIAVHPAHRKSGLAVAMNQLIFGESRKRGFRKLLAVIYKSNTASRSMTARSGFEELPLQMNSLDKVVMVKRLDG